ncbi:cobalt-precorrin-6A reductase [Rhodoferax koreense]|uniref:Cobalt-precorrin-6A reductase n=1 Tax=Rhodoferax koreensis TaxID=1842727 RepID=A0A1P8JS50_9BURK|nr:cobalt-precorrin-6A reductase [Rhodoferax koreense]APW36576.1 cobalt-precorrin-6A reductase [Rhodoferax koreense]
MPRVLVLGGTSEASQLAHALAEAGVAAVFSYAGRVASPLPQPIPTRVGGFGGPAGLRAWLEAERITHVVDATHPFAAGMSRNAVDACAAAGVALLALERPAWAAQPGDRWRHVADTDAAVAALPTQPARVFLAIGRQQVAPFLARGQHWYLLRLVDPAPELAGLHGEILLARGPFTAAGDQALMQAHGITQVVAKNAGGTGAEAKLQAARALGLPVILIDRPALPARHTVGSVAEVMRWLGCDHSAHGADLGV